MDPDDSSDSNNQQSFLLRKVCELPLSIQSTHLEELIFQLYGELGKAGINFRPPTYLSDTWGCPNEVPSIGIPFYLSDPLLCNIYTHFTGARFEDDQTIMMILRHEAGHAFNYAYRLYDSTEWQSLFGPFSLPYRDEYNPNPLSTRFVRHIPGCYAQKHPDDDFAETFAVWITPSSEWPKTYAGTPALAKLLYVNRIAADLGRRTPLVTGGRLDMPFEEIHLSLGEWCRTVS